MFVVEWPRGEARDCKSLYTGSNPVSTSTNSYLSNEGKISVADIDSERPWGRYEVLSTSDVHQVKNIYVLPGKRLSYQRHQKRAEHWLIIAGSARVTLDGRTLEISAGDSVDIGIGVAHRIENVGANELIFTEIQTGTYFGEEDIERIEDDFGRL
jgi:mannose-6-phosphate isomerase